VLAGADARLARVRARRHQAGRPNPRLGMRLRWGGGGADWRRNYFASFSFMSAYVSLEGPREVRRSIAARL
jgi:hypothetical protein